MKCHFCMFTFRRRKILNFTSFFYNKKRVALEFQTNQERTQDTENMLVQIINIQSVAYAANTKAFASSIDPIIYIELIYFIP